MYICVFPYLHILSPFHETVLAMLKKQSSINHWIMPGKIIKQNWDKSLVGITSKLDKMN